MEGRKYVEAPLHRRFLASLADLALFLFVFLGIFAIFEAAFSASDWYKGAHQRTEELLSESLLFVQGEDGEWGAPTGAKDYLAYQDLLLSYYEEGIHETVPEEAPDLKGRSLAYWYNVNVIGLEDIDRVYGYLELSSPAKEKGKELFQWPLLPDGTVDKGGLAAPADKLFQSGSAYDEEGRIITLEYPTAYLVGAYVPNSGEGLKRLSFRMEYEDRLLAYLKKLDAIKPVIYTGDLNVAHERIDIKNPDANVHNAGFTPEERNKMDVLLSSGFADTFRRLHPEEVKYSWWSYRFHARENNAGWRIDYFLVSERILGKVKASEIHNEIYGSDHCPVLLDIEL